MKNKRWGEEATSPSPRRKLKFRTKIVLCVLAGIVLVLTVALSVVCHSRALYAGKISGDKAYKSVLSEIEDISEANPRVVDLGMLGAHDANTYNLEEYNGASGEVGGDLKAVYKLAYGLSYRYTKTQVSDIYDQLCQGVRFLNFKCSYHSGKWCGSHSFIDGPMETYIKDVIRFVKDAPGEIVVVESQVMYAEGHTLSELVSDFFAVEYEGQTLKDFILYENIPIKDLTYNDVTQEGTQGGIVFLVTTDGKLSTPFVDKEKSEYRGKFYAHPGMFSGKWYNRMKTSAIADGIGKQCEVIRADDRYMEGFRLMLMQTSPNAKDFFETAGAWSLLKKAKSHNLKMLANPAFAEWLSVMPVVLCDNVTSANGDFNKKINEKIASYNRSLVETLLSAS